MRRIIVLTGFLAGAATLQLRRQSSDSKRRATEWVGLRRTGEGGGGDCAPEGSTDDWLLWEVELAADWLEQ